MQLFVCRKCFSDMHIDESLGLKCNNMECNNTKPYKNPTGKIITTGVELEGGWYKFPDNEGDFKYSVHDDGSVDLDDDEDSCGECEACENGDYCSNKSSGCHYVGELVSPILRLNQWEAWINHCYPDEFNSSCGTHIHFGFNNTSAYENLCCKEFNDYFIRELKAWGKRNHITNDNFWDRIKGGNSMCSPEFSGKTQIEVKEDNYPDCRYRMLNFQYNKHGTLEVRVLPVFRSKIVEVKAIKAVIRIINSWLKHTGFSDVEVDNDNIDFPAPKSKIKQTVVREV